MRETIGYITYRLGDKIKIWSVGCHPELDNKETLKAHLKRWAPTAQFIKAEIKFITKRNKNIKNL